jgi:hypothetical protein
MKQFISHAVLDLDEAMIWLGVTEERPPDAEERWLSFVQSILESASSRLLLAREYLSERGCGAMLIP